MGAAVNIAARMEQTAPVWAVFGDLMAGLLGAFVLILVGVLVILWWTRMRKHASSN